MSVATPIPIGATVRINKPGHFAHGRLVTVSDLPTIEIGGLDLGLLVAFADVDWQGEAVEHVLPVEWVELAGAAVVPLCPSCGRAA